MKDLFTSLSELNVENDFALQFEILGIGKLWTVARELACEPILRNKLVKYCVYAYSIESPLLRKKKDRWEVKESIVSFLEIDVNDLVLDCMRCKNTQFNKFITEWLRESQSRDFSYLISLEDSMYELFELAREGIDFTCTSESSWDVTKALSVFRKNEILIKSEARKRAMEMKREIDTLEKQLSKDYEYLHGIVRKDSVQIADNLQWAERAVLRYKQRNQQ